jgi:hypothetical protein
MDLRTLMELGGWSLVDGHVRYTHPTRHREALERLAADHEEALAAVHEQADSAVGE